VFGIIFVIKLKHKPSTVLVYRYRLRPCRCRSTTSTLWIGARRIPLYATRRQPGNWRPQT